MLERKKTYGTIFSIDQVICKTKLIKLKKANKHIYLKIQSFLMFKKLIFKKTINTNILITHYNQGSCAKFHFI